MKLKYLYIILYTLLCLNNNAQMNLVPNPSFEDTIGDCQLAMVINTFSNSKVRNWNTIAGSSPDYMNMCANSISYPSWSTIPSNAHSYQYPHTGNAYVDIYTYYPLSSTDSSLIDAEYLITQLKQPLKNNTCYYTEMYVNLASVSNIAINQISILISQNTYTSVAHSFTNFIQPQVQWDTTKYFTDTLNWVKIAGTFIAQGGEQYLTIGNFKDGTHLKKTAFNSSAAPFSNCFLIDDVSLYELPTPQLQSSYVICTNSDSLVIGDTARIQTRYQWYANGLAIDTTSYITIKPSQTTTYVLHTTNCSTSTQTVVVTYSNNCNPTLITEPTIPNVFTPNGDGVNDVFSFTFSGALTNFSLYNRWGNIIQTTNNQSHTTILWDGRTTSGEACSAGVYFYTLEYKDSKGAVIKKNGYVSLIR